MKCYITNGTLYITFPQGRPYFYATSIGAHKFKNPERAWNFLNYNKNHLEGFYVTDLEGTIVEEPDMSGNGSARRKLSEHERQYVYKKYNGTCVYCGQSVMFPYMTVDHIIPLSKGGTNEFSNLQLTCQKCNRIKGDLKTEDFFTHIKAILAWNQKLNNY